MRDLASRTTLTAPQFLGDEGGLYLVEDHPAKRADVRVAELASHEFEQAANDVFIVLLVPLSRQFAVVVGQLNERAFLLPAERFRTQAQDAIAALDPVGSGCPEPLAERPRAVALEFGRFAADDEHDVLGQVLACFLQERIAL
jgi:hypothetical protein